MSFFDNHYVQDVLMGLNLRHRPVRRAKLTKLFRCAADVLQKKESCFNLRLDSPCNFYFLAILCSVFDIDPLVHGGVLSTLSQLFCSIYF